MTVNTGEVVLGKEMYSALDAFEEGATPERPGVCHRLIEPDPDDGRIIPTYRVTLERIENLDERYFFVTVQVDGTQVSTRHDDEFVLLRMGGELSFDGDVERFENRRGFPLSLALNYPDHTDDDFHFALIQYYQDRENPGLGRFGHANEYRGNSSGTHGVRSLDVVDLERELFDGADWENRPVDLEMTMRMYLEGADMEGERLRAGEVYFKPLVYEIE